MAIPDEATAVNLVTYPVTLYELTGDYDDPVTFNTVYVKTDGTGWDERRTDNGAPRCLINGPNIRVPALAAYAGQQATAYLDITLATGFSRDGRIRIWADGAEVSQVENSVTPGVNVIEFTVPSTIVDPATLEVRISYASTNDDTRLIGARVAAGQDDGLGVIYGGDDKGTLWAGEPWTSASYLAVSDPEPIEVTALPPEWTDDPNRGLYTWTTPSVEGVVYSPASGTARAGETVTVTATAVEGYVIVGDSEWSYTFANPNPDPEDPEPEDPEPEDPEPVPSVFT